MRVNLLTSLARISSSAYLSRIVKRQFSLTMSGSSGHVLVYGGRGALGSTIVDFLKGKNFVCL